MKNEETFRKDLAEASRLADKIGEVLNGVEVQTQGIALALSAAMWVAGHRHRNENNENNHTTKQGEDLRTLMKAMHIQMLEKLVPAANARMVDIIKTEEAEAVGAKDGNDT